MNQERNRLIDCLRLSTRENNSYINSVIKKCPYVLKGKIQFTVVEFVDFLNKITDNNAIDIVNSSFENDLLKISNFANLYNVNKNYKKLQERYIKPSLENKDADNFHKDTGKMKYDVHQSLNNLLLKIYNHNFTDQGSKLFLFSTAFISINKQSSKLTEDQYSNLVQSDFNTVSDILRIEKETFNKDYLYADFNPAYNFLYRFVLFYLMKKPWINIKDIYDCEEDVPLNLISIIFKTYNNYTLQIELESLTKYMGILGYNSNYFFYNYPHIMGYSKVKTDRLKLTVEKVVSRLCFNICYTSGVVMINRDTYARLFFKLCVWNDDTTDVLFKNVMSDKIFNNNSAYEFLKKETKYLFYAFLRYPITVQSYSKNYDKLSLNVDTDNINPNKAFIKLFHEMVNVRPSLQLYERFLNDAFFNFVDNKDTEDVSKYAESIVYMTSRNNRMKKITNEPVLKKLYELCVRIVLSLLLSKDPYKLEDHERIFTTSVMTMVLERVNSVNSYNIRDMLYEYFMCESKFIKK